MIEIGRSFPFVPLSEQDVTKVKAACGGTDLDKPIARGSIFDVNPRGRVVDSESIRSFLALSCLPMFANPDYAALTLQRQAIETAEALELPTSAVRPINQGSLFIAGVIGLVCNEPELPLDPEALDDIKTVDPVIMAISCLGDIKELNPTFCSLAADVRPALALDDDRMFDAMLIGAGTVQKMLSETVQRRTDAAFMEMMALDFELE